MTADCRVDECDLVWIAAAASQCRPANVLAEADVGALARVVADAEDACDAVHRAATLLVAIASYRPFAHDNLAVAWFAAAYVLDGAGVSIACSDDELADLVNAAARREIGPDDVVRALADARSRAAAPATTLVRSCPACGRELHEGIFEGRNEMIGASRFELVARCWVEHRAHDRDGRAFHAPKATLDDGSRPFVANADDSARLVIIDTRAALIERESAGQGFAVALVEDVEPGMLVGSWERLRAHAGEPHIVSEDAVRLDETGQFLDWHRIESELGWTTSPTERRQLVVA